MRPVYILGGARTPFATWARGRRGDGLPGGAFKDVDPFDLGAAALKGALERSGLPPDSLERVVFGNMYHVGPHACYGTRYVALRAGVPPEVPTPTVSMACGSGLYALLDAASAVREGLDLVAAGGTDNSSQIRRDVFVPSFVDLAADRRPIGSTVEELAASYGIGRDAMDAWALRSHKKAADARAAGRLGEELVPLAGLDHDDHPLSKPSLDPFKAKEPVHGPGGGITSANTHAIVDAASSVILGSEKAAKAGRPLGRLVAGALAGTAPEKMGYASVPAIRQALTKAALAVGDVDLFEINETFAAQVLIDLRELGIPEVKTNVNGGAIALGHPFAATGCKQVLGLLLELRRRGLRWGVASICIGGGQGVAVVVEAV